MSLPTPSPRQVGAAGANGCPPKFTESVVDTGLFTRPSQRVTHRLRPSDSPGAAKGMATATIPFSIRAHLPLPPVPRTAVDHQGSIRNVPWPTARPGHLFHRVDRMLSRLDEPPRDGQCRLHSLNPGRSRARTFRGTKVQSERLRAVYHTRSMGRTEGPLLPIGRLGATVMSS